MLLILHPLSHGDTYELLEGNTKGAVAVEAALLGELHGRDGTG